MEDDSSMGQAAEGAERAMSLGWRLVDLSSLTAWLSIFLQGTPEACRRNGLPPALPFYLFVHGTPWGVWA